MKTTSMGAKKQKPRFIAHYGGPQPVGDDVMVEVILRGEKYTCKEPADFWALGLSNWWMWETSFNDVNSNIIAYRVLGENE